MKNNHWYILLFLFISSMMLSFYPRKNYVISTGITVAELSAVDEEIKLFMTEWKIPGASVALIKDNKVIYLKGFGYADEKIPATPRHLFRIASISKPITAVAILKLVQEKKVSLNSVVFGSDGILNDTEFQFISDPEIKTITIKHLLEHTAGWDRNISSCGDPMFNPVEIAKCMNEAAPASSKTVLKYMLTQRLDFTPGTKYAYSNFGYSILGRVIEKVSGMSYESFVRSRILIPMGITNMILGKNFYCDKESNEVKYYDSYNRVIPSVCEPGKTVAFPYGGFNLEAMDAHGGWLASAEDLSRFMSGIGSVLNKETFREMIDPSPVNKGYAKGWFVNPQGSFWHTGSLVGTSSMVADVKGTIGWVLLFNSNPQTNRYFTELDRLMWKAIGRVHQWPKTSQL